MIKFKNIKTGEIETAFSLREDGEKTYVKFSSDGKEYGYFKSNIEIITSDINKLPFHVGHLQDPSIEYYGLNVIGDIEEFDHMLMGKYPERIKNIYSKTKNRIYPMNICSHCGSGQGWYFIYRDINEMIKSRAEIILFEQ